MEMGGATRAAVSGSFATVRTAVTVTGATTSLDDAVANWGFANARTSPEMRVLITGSSGFIGSNFHRRLAADHQVAYVDIASPIRAHRMDCRKLFRTCDERFDLLIHAAAVIGSRQERDENPLAVYENLALDQAAIAWCLRTGTPLLYFSSSAVYSVKKRGPFRESLVGSRFEILDADDAYGYIKLVGERQAHDLWCLQVPVTIVRPFSGYGADQSEDYPFRAILERVKRREDPLTVWSDTTRDFVHVEDIVSACLVLTELGTLGPVNIGTGVPTRMSELARMMAEQAGYEPEIKILHQSEGPDHRFADTSFMETFYKPRISLAEGIEMALKE